MDRQFNLLIKTVEGDGEESAIRNIKFGVHIQKKIKNLILKRNFKNFVEILSQ